MIRETSAQAPIKPGRFGSASRFVATSPVLLLCCAGLPALADPGPVQVYILAGQSNMVGQGEMSPASSPGTLEYTVTNDPDGPFPFVIATTGMEGWSESKTTALALMQAQLNVAQYPEFQGNVFTVDTRDYWRDGSVSPVASGQEFHWNRNALSYLDIGAGMAEAMTTLEPARCPSALRAAGGTDGITLSWSYGTDIPTSVQILRDDVEIESVLAGSNTTYLDTGAAPGVSQYELVFTMPGDPCDPISTTIDTCLSDLTAVATGDDVVLTWQNHLTYQGIEITRDGSVLVPSLSGTLETYTDTNPPSFGIVTYTAVSTNGTCTPASTTVNLNTRSINGPVLFADTFDRANSTDLNASTDGKSGTLGALNYTGRTIGGSITLDVNNNALRVNGEANGSFGGLVYINDHNFADAFLEAGGGFAVTVDLPAYSSAGSSRQMSVGVGQSLAELDAQSGANSVNHASDLVVAYRNTSVVALEIYKNGVLDETETVSGGLPDVPTTMRIEYLLSSFNAGSTVTYAVYFDDSETPLTSGSFTWGDTGQNYIPVGNNLTDTSKLDNFEISANAVPPDDYDNWAANYPTADFSDPDGDFDKDGLSNNAERIWGFDPASGSSSNPYAVPVDESGSFSYTRRDPALSGLTYTVWTSTNLVDWDEDAEATQVPGDPDGNDVETVAVALTASPVNSRLFVRIQAE